MRLRTFWLGTCGHPHPRSLSTRPPDQPRDPTMDQSSPPTPDREPPPRLRRPDRQRPLVRPRTIDQLIPEDHPARALWALVQRWDLTPFLRRIRARGARPGRAATDP